MNESRIDPERLAAQLDGRLSERERREIIAHLAASEDALEAYLDAVAVAHEPEIGNADGGVAQATVADRRRFARNARRLALAAVAAGIALAPWLWMQVRSPVPPDPARLVALLAEADVAPDGFAAPWSASRGADSPVSASARAARIGVRLVHLELTLRSGDPTAAALAGEVATLLEGVPAGGPAAALFREIERRAGESPEALAEPLDRGREAAAALTDLKLLSWAAWAEAARLAAAGRDGRFFDARMSRRALDRAANDGSLPRPARDALRSIAGTLRAGDGPRDWAGLEQVLTRLVRDLTE